MKRGSIACRKDPADKHEWQFALRKSVAWAEEEARHAFQGESNAKVEAAHWLELKAQGLLEDGTEDKTLADRVLQDVLPNNSKGSGNKQPLALKDMSEDETGSKNGHAKKEDKDGQVAEAEVLSDVGKALPKKEAALRVSRMVKLLKAVRKDVGAAKGKPLDECMANLEKLQKMGDKVSLEDAKGKLFDAAIQIKKVKKM